MGHGELITSTREARLVHIQIYVPNANMEGRERERERGGEREREKERERVRERERGNETNILLSVLHSN